MNNIDELMRASKEALDDLHNDEEFQIQVEELNELIEQENRRTLLRLTHVIFNAIKDVLK